MSELLSTFICKDPTPYFKYQPYQKMYNQGTAAYQLPSDDFTNAYIAPIDQCWTTRCG